MAAAEPGNSASARTAVPPMADVQKNDFIDAIETNPPRLL